MIEVTKQANDIGGQRGKGGPLRITNGSMIDGGEDGMAAGLGVRVETEEGLFGFSTCRCAIGPAVSRLASQCLANCDPRAVASLWQELTVLAADDREAIAAAAALDIALWDLKAKSEGVPLWRCLGGEAPAARFFSEIETPEAVTEGVEAALYALTDDAPRDTLVLDHLHATLARRTSYPLLLLRCPEAWPVAHAAERLKTIERRFEINLVIPPHHWQAADFETLSDAIGAGVSNHPGIGGPAAFAPLFTTHALDAVLIDIHMTGISGALQIADAAFAFEWPVMLAASSGNIAAHLSGALPYFSHLAFAPDGVLPPGMRSNVRCSGSRIVCGEDIGNGLGIDIAVASA